MYNAIIRYNFKPEKIKDAIKLWEDGVYKKITEQEGFIRVQLYSNEDGEVIAIGSWEDKKYADAFMQTGVFKNVLETFNEYLQEIPRNKIFDLEFFQEK